MARRHVSPKSARPKRPQKVMDIAPPHKDFPRIGATLSTYRPVPNGSGAAVAARAGIIAVDRKAVRAHRVKKTLKWVGIILAAILIAWGLWVGWKFVRNIEKLHGGLFGLFSHHQLKGEDTGRVNILLAGYSVDDPGHGGAQLTDSIMIISIDTKDHTAFMMSVPRDLYVKYDTNGCDAGDQGKINAVYECGQQLHFSEPGYPNGGMGLLEKVVSEDFGLPIDYYALIDYTAIKDGVNAVGGIDVNIQSSNPYGLYDPSIDWTTHGPLVKLSNGWHHLDGEQALDLARARGDAYGSYGFAQGDFTRTQNQRMMLLALKNKAMSAGTLANPIKLGELFDSFGNNIQTDFQTSDLQELYSIGKQLNSSNIKSIGLNDVNGKDLLTSYYSYSAGDSLIPAAGKYDYSAIQAYVQQLTAPPATSSNK